MCNLIPVATTVGAIPYPLGNPGDSKEQQWKLRYHRVGVALDALTAEIKEQTVFKVKI